MHISGFRHREVSLASLRRHVAARPCWRCRECGAPWPCQPAKLGLRAEYAHDRGGLAVYLCLLMYDAIADRLRTHPDEVNPAEFFSRFIGWTRVETQQAVRLDESADPREIP